MVSLALQPVTPSIYICSQAGNLWLEAATSGGPPLTLKSTEIVGGTEKPVRTSAHAPAQRARI